MWPKLLRFVCGAGSPFHFTSQPLNNEAFGEKKAEVKKFEKPTRQRSVLCCKSLTFRVLICKSLCGFECSKIFFIDYRSSPRKPLPSVSTLKKPATGKSGYCEICNVTFRRLEEHLETPKHKTYVANDSHYHCIDKLIPGHQDFQDLISSELQVWVACLIFNIFS